MGEGLTINVEGVDSGKGGSIIKMSGTKPAIMPDIVAKNRLRLKAIRVVGLEEFGRSAGEAIGSGDFGRVTEILHYDEMPNGLTAEFDADVRVERDR